MRRVDSGDASASLITALATRTVPWATNHWQALYNSREATLRTVIAGILGVPVASLTNVAMDTCIRERVANNAAEAGAIYQTAGFRQPNLEVVADATRTGTADAVYIIYVNDRNDNSAPQGSPSEAISLLGLGYGLLYVNSNDVNDTPAEPLGSILDCVAHEMFHSIQFGYDLGYSDTSKGYHEGTATTYGSTIDKESTHAPQVRLDDAPHKLSSFLGYERTAYVYQDFYAFVGRAYNSDSLDYLADVFEQMKTDVDALVGTGETKARLAPPRETLRRSLNTAFMSKFSQDLPTIYLDYVRQRAMEHSADSQLRTGEPAFLTLNPNLFHADALQRISADPTGILSTSLEGTFNNVAPFSSRAIVITPSRAVADITAELTITSTVGPWAQP